MNTLEANRGCDVSASRIEFGISINPAWSEKDEIFQLVRLAEEVGLDLIGIQDHPYQGFALFEYPATRGPGLGYGAAGGTGPGGRSMNVETMARRHEALVALVGPYDPGLGDCTGALDIETEIVHLGARAGLAPWQALDLTRPLEEIIDDG